MHVKKFSITNTWVNNFIAYKFAYQETDSMPVKLTTTSVLRVSGLFSNECSPAALHVSCSCMIKETDRIRQTRELSWWTLSVLPVRSGLRVLCERWRETSKNISRNDLTTSLLIGSSKKLPTVAGASSSSLVAGVLRSSASVCLSVCLFARSKVRVRIRVTKHISVFPNLSTCSILMNVSSS